MNNNTIFASNAQNPETTLTLEHFIVGLVGLCKLRNLTRTEAEEFIKFEDSLRLLVLVPGFAPVVRDIVYKRNNRVSEISEYIKTGLARYYDSKPEMKRS